MKSRRIIDQILEIFVVIVISVLILDVVWNVFARYILNAPSSFSVELARYLLIWIGLFGSAYASGQKEHIAINLLPQKLQKRDPRKKENLDKIINTLIALFALLVLVVGGAKLVFMSFQMGQISPTLQIPLGYVYLALPLSGLLIMFYAVHEIFYGLPENLKQ